MTQNKLIIISGPTASGKTSLSLDLCRHLNEKYAKKAEIVNFDSLLFYKELNIGTAKPSLQERGNIVHHLIDISSAKSPLNAADYIKKAEDTIGSLMEKGIIPILVGGSGFYLRALMKGMYETQEISPELKTEIQNLYKEKGIEPILEELRRNDPESLKTLHNNDHYRLLRAYEFFRATAKPISEEKKKMEDKLPYDFSKGVHPNWNFLHYYLDLPKDLHEKVIRKRVEIMLQDGLIEEVQKLLLSGFTGLEKPLQSIGYKEVIQYLKHEIPNQEKLIDQIVVATRQLAKAQRTFFAKVSPKRQLNPLDERDLAYTSLENFLAH